MKAYRILYFAALLIFFAAGNAISQKRTGVFDIQYNFKGTALYFTCYVPVDYDSAKSYPLIFTWHGAGGNSQDMVNFTVAALALNVGAIVICPNLPETSTNDQVISFIQTAPYWIHQNYSIDTKKEVLYGFTEGGGLVYRVGLSFPELFDGIIGLAPVIDDLSPEMWQNIKEIRMATILGTLDLNYDIVSELMKSIKAGGGTLLYKEKSGIQHVDNTYFGSQEFKTDLLECYNFVLNISSPVEDETINKMVFIYPNPAKDYINVSGLSGRIEIINSLGEEVWSGVVEEKGKINIGELNAGTYILKSRFSSVKLLKL